MIKQRSNMTKECELIQKECILGINTNVRSVHVLNNDQILYSCANHVVIWQQYDKSQIFIHQCHPLEHIKMTSLCHSRKTLAVVIAGKDGPYIVLYDAITHRRKKVLRQNDETLNIIGISFSKDGKQCLVLGDGPSYLLSLWNIEKVPKILISIRLATPSGKQIRRADMCPTDSRLICVSGNGIIRFFRIASDSRVFRPLTVQLRREQQNYVHHCWLSSGNVVLATDRNELIVIQNFEEKIIVPIHNWDQSLTAITPLGKSFMIGGDRGSIRLYRVTDEDQISVQTMKEMAVGEDTEILAFDRFEPDNLAICLVGTGRICNIAMSNFGQSDIMADSVTGGDVVPSFHTQIEGEKNIVCMDICTWKTILATGGYDKTLRIWDFKRKAVDLIHHCEDDIVSISLHPMSLQILLCCKTYVSISEILQNRLSPVWRRNIQTNGSSCFSNGGHYYALSIGDFVQIYNTFTHEIICTLRGHSAPVQSVCWKGDDLNVATIGRDGAVCIWNTWSGERIFRHANEAQAYVNGYLSEDFGTAVMNTRGGVEVLDIQSNSLVPGCDFPAGSQVLSYSMNVIVASYPDSTHCGEVWIRSIFDQSCGTTVRSGPHLCLHSQTISCVRISSDHDYLFTGSVDGAVCISKLHRLFPQREYKYNEDVGCIILEDYLASEVDLEKKDRYITSLREKLDQTKAQQKIELGTLEEMHEETVNRLKQKVHSEHERFEVQIQEENAKVEEMSKDLSSDLKAEKDRLTLELQAATDGFGAELQAEKLKAKEIGRLRAQELAALQSKMEQIRKDFSENLNDVKVTYELKIRDVTSEAEKIKEETKVVVANFTRTADAIQEQVDKELIIGHQLHEEAAFQEVKASTRLKEEHDIKNKRYEALLKDYDDKKYEALSLQDKQSELIIEIERIEKEKTFFLKESHKESIFTMKLEREINSLVETTHQMERSKMTQTEKITEIKVDLTAKQEDMQSLHQKGEDLKTQFQIESKRNSDLRIKVQQDQLKVKALQNEHESETLKLQNLTEEHAALKLKIGKAHDLKGKIPELKKYLINLSRTHFSSNKNASGTQSYTCNSLTRECQVKRRKIKSTEGILKRSTKLHNGKMEQLDLESKVLKKHLLEIEREISWLKEKQNKIFQ